MAFKIAIIGCGNMSAYVHGPALARYALTHPGTELAACCDLDEKRVAAYRERFGFLRHFTNLDTMLETVRPDAVSLVVREHDTAKLGCHILKKSFPLILEKPPGVNIRELRSLIRTADVRQVPHQVAFNRRYHPVLRALKKQAGSPGELHIRYTMTRVKRLDADFSHTAIHALDAMRFLAGSDYARAAIGYRHFPELGPTVANVFLDCAFVSGATAQLTICPVTGTSVERAEVYALDNFWCGELEAVPGAPEMPGALRHFKDGKCSAEFSGAALAGGTEYFLTNGFYAENEAFFDAVRNGTRPVDDLRSCVQAVALAQALRERRSAVRFRSIHRPACRELGG
ncbi:MAG: Gfo/Idh/MocA family oxidoreductase [Planctomycetota bacterium]|nr:Gfo/Idh/MocA family oxidoreductase [Planctomycetota bacterium]